MNRSELETTGQKAFAVRAQLNGLARIGAYPSTQEQDAA